MTGIMMKAGRNKVGIFNSLEVTFLFHSLVHHGVDTASEGVLLMSITDSLIYFYNSFSTIKFF